VLTDTGGEIRAQALAAYDGTALCRQAPEAVYPVECRAFCFVSPALEKLGPSSDRRGHPASVVSTN
jgi:hypothetical protein